MLLQDFILATLTEIVEGVAKSQEVLLPKGVHVMPLVRSGDLSNPGRILGRTSPTSVWRNVYAVDFDVSVIASTENGKEGKLNVLGGALGIGGAAHNKTQDGQQSRVQFTIPLAFPDYTPE